MLSLNVSDALVILNADQHLDSLTIGDRGVVRLAGARMVVLDHLVIGGMDLGTTILTPEPATLGLLALGASCVLLRRRKK